MNTNARVRKTKQGQTAEQGTNPVPHQSALPKRSKVTYPSMAKEIEKISDPVSMTSLLNFYGLNDSEEAK